MAASLVPLTAGRALPAASTPTVDPQERNQAIAVRDDGWITDVAGIKVGHFTEKERPTGCTVILCEQGAICGVHVPGGWPGTRLTDMLDPMKRADDSVKVHGVVLTGGSVYGLSSASGVERFFRDRYFRAQAGDTIPKAQVFVIPAAVIYDLSLGGDWRITPTAESGYQACEGATSGPVAEGCVGAGAGAMVGHWGKNPTKSGLGTSSIRVGDTGLVVGAICAVNSSGDVYNPKTGRLVSGSRSADGMRFSPVIDRIRAGFSVEPPAPGTHTTIATVATNARFTKTETAKIAQMASAGLARAINPAWGPGDGDTVFAISTGTMETPVSHGAIGAIAAEALIEAILRAVTKATATAGVPAWRDIVEAEGHSSGGRP
jgi:L-aminopeptidase/D-esterase-like protein